MNNDGDFACSSGLQVLHMELTEIFGRYKSNGNIIGDKCACALLIVIKWDTGLEKLLQCGMLLPVKQYPTQKYKIQVKHYGWTYLKVVMMRNYHFFLEIIKYTLTNLKRSQTTKQHFFQTI